MGVDDFEMVSGNATPVKSQIAVPEIVLTGTSSILSIVGAIIIFATYSFVPKEYNFTRKLLVYLTIADFITAVGNLVGVSRYVHVYGIQPTDHTCTNDTSTLVKLSGLCTVQSYFTTASNMASFLWTLVIAFHIWATVILKINVTSRKVPHVLYHVVCWGIPIAIVSTIVDHLGEDYCYGTGVWCGIKTDNKTELKRLMLRADVAWQLTSYVTSCFFYLHITFYMFLHRRSLSAASNNQLRKEDRNYLLVWLVLYVLKLWGIIRFFLTAYLTDYTRQLDTTQKWLDILLIGQSYGASGQAFWNCILFCFCDETVRGKMLRRKRLPSEAEADTGNERTPLLVENGDVKKQAVAAYEKTPIIAGNEAKLRGSINSHTGTLPT